MASDYRDAASAKWRLQNIRADRRRSPIHPVGLFYDGGKELTAAEELPQEMRRRLPQQVSGFTLARLGISLHAQGQGLGSYILLEAMEKAYRASLNVGGYALFVDAKDGMASFYEHHGFQPCPDDANTLVIPIASLPKFPESVNS